MICRPFNVRYDCFPQNISNVLIIFSQPTRTAVQSTLFRSNKDERPLFVPAGTRCAFSTILMHRRKDLWGPDALKFDPERFLDERLHKYRK
jgi:hypothetical protein